MSVKIPLESFLMAHFVKYENLSVLVNQAFSGSQATEVNLYIDMYSITKSLYSDSCIANITDYRSVIACIINMCAHYRHYFRKYLGVNTKIFIINSLNCPETNRKFVAGYNEIMYRKFTSNTFIKNMVNHNTDLMNIIIPYLPEIYFVNSQYESSVVISSIIDKQCKNGNSNPNIIITRDILYNMQLLSLHPETAILRPTKNKNGDVSYIIEPLRNDMISINRYWQNFCNELGCKNIDINIHPINTSLLLSLSRLPDRNLKSIMNINTAKRYINNIVGNNPIKCSIQSIIDNGISAKCGETIIFNRYKSIDVEFQKSIYESTIEYRLLDFKDLYDPEAVKDINNRYFESNPLDLDKL